MSAARWPNLEEDSRRTLAYAAGAAFLIEAVLLTLVGWDQHWLAHPQKSNTIDTSQFVEAQIFEVPKEAPHLTEEKPVPVPHHETVLSKVVNQGRQPKPGENQNEDKNQTESGAPVAPTHGPVAVFSPSPAIPEYLRNQNLNTSVVIDFYVSAQGATTPRLVNSSGNEELDAIAIATAKRWQFRPAEKDHKPIDAKVRLRILFEVK